MSKYLIRMITYLMALLLTFWLTAAPVDQAAPVTTLVPAAPLDLCPISGVQPRPATLPVSGLIVTTFDRNNLWVVNLDRRTRYPLADTRPCGTNCHLSPDFRWLTYLGPSDALYYRMRLDGSERTFIADDATDVQWWSAETLLVWSPAHQVRLLDFSGAALDLPGADLAFGAINLQPGGYRALALRYAADATGNDFQRVLLNLKNPADVRPLTGVERPYFSAAAWSPDGAYLAYVAPVATSGGVGGEIYGVSLRPEPGFPAQWTRLSAADDRLRIGGQTPAGGLRWSPDGTKLAFWGLPLTGDDPAAQAESEAVLYMLDRTTGETRRYCGYTTLAHTPHPPIPVWSPDGAYLAFADNPPDDPRGYLLIALEVATGTFYELSDGIYPALGVGHVVAWGLPPG